ncbi:MAG: methyltransferase domain-containing protein [Desulfocurvibacter africanus]
METAVAKKLKQHRVCPWWLAYMFDNPLRRMMHPPEKLLGRYVAEGMTVLDLGCGFGHFSIGMARIVGETGKVWAVDLQDRMLQTMLRRAAKQGMEERIVAHRCGPAGLGLTERIDFALAANVLHEVPDLRKTLDEIRSLLCPGGLLYVMEPAGHISRERFEAEIAIVRDLGFVERSRPEVLREHCVLLEAPETKSRA